MRMTDRDREREQWYYVEVAPTPWHLIRIDRRQYSYMVGVCHGNMCWLRFIQKRLAIYYTKKDLLPVIRKGHYAKWNFLFFIPIWTTWPLCRCLFSQIELLQYCGLISVLLWSPCCGLISCSYGLVVCSYCLPCVGFCF